MKNISPQLRDDIGDGFFVNRYLDARFQGAKRELDLSKAVAPVYCTQLVCMSVDVIEKLTPYLIDTRIPEILSDRMMSDRDLRAPFFLKPMRSLLRKGDPASSPFEGAQCGTQQVAAVFLKVEPQNDRDAS